ncbi:uL30 family ribosomal protein [Candidatus Woesearchaeota archaeon]|nr:uL30 family ribosomal protein [Candidatus Woesearchaeota archaeon]
MNEESKKRLAVVRIRGNIGLKNEVKDTLKMLNLHRNNYCTVVPNKDSFLGMVRKVKDYVAYGELDDETYKLLVEKRGEKKGDKLKKFFRLGPPRKGFERKGVKIPFKKGGAIGYRAGKINDLIKRMI